MAGNTPVTAISADALPNHSHQFVNFDEMTKACIEGRMPSGHHFRFSSADALHLGRHIARAAHVIDLAVNVSIESAVAR